MKNKKQLIIFVITFIITCIIFIPFLTGHYATDSYNIANIGYKEYAIKWSLKDGRILMCLIGLIASKINISIEVFIFITLFIALIISNITVVFLINVVKRYKKPQNIIQEIILIVISYVTIFNFTYLENMYFAESIVMALALLLFIISANILVEKDKNYIIKSLFLNIIGVMCYQGTVGMLFAFVTLFTILKNKNNVKQIIIDIMKSGILALIPILINIITVKLIGNIMNLEQNRLGQVSDIFNNVKVIIITLPTILQRTCNLFQKNMLILFTIALIFVIIMYIYKDKEKSDIIYKSLAIIFMLIASGCVVYVLTLSSFYTGRLRNSIGALIGVLFILLYVETNIFEKKEKISIITYLILITYIIVNILNYENIMFKHKEVNNLEKIQVKEIEQYIDKYEKDTGIKVTKIVKVPQKTVYEENENDIIRNALKTNWASDGVINFYTKRNLETIELTKEQAIYYYKNFDKEKEYQCIGDILYINVYVF